MRRRRAAGMVVVGAAVVALGAGALRHPSPVQPQEALIRDVVSGRAGLRATPSGANEHWTSPPAFVLDPSLDRIDPQAKEAVINAFAAWDTAGIGLPKASFTISSARGEARQDGVSRILYGPIEVKGLEDALAVTIAYADGASGEIREADVIINSKHDFAVFPSAPAKGEATSEECDGHYDLQNVATHEAGHVYGLGEDREDRSTTMFITSDPCETHKRALTSTDHEVMSALYATHAAATAAATPAQPPAAGCGATVASSRDTRGGPAWLLAAAACLSALRRRRAS